MQESIVVFFENGTPPAPPLRRAALRAISNKSTYLNGIQPVAPENGLKLSNQRLNLNCQDYVKWRLNLTI